MKNLIKYLTKYWYLYLIAIVSMIISVSLDVLAPQVTRLIVDDVIIGGQTEQLLRFLLSLVGIGVGRAIFQFVKEYIFDINGMKISSDMRRNVFAHIQTLSVKYFDKNNTGELMARVKDDIGRVGSAVGFIGMLIIECVIHVIFVIYCMMRINPLLTILPLMIMPIVGVIAVKMEKKLDKVYDEISEENAKLNTVAQENLAGVRTVKAFARENFEINKFKSRNKKYYDLNMRQAKIIRKNQPNISFLTKTLLLAVVAAGGVLVMLNQKDGSSIGITLGQLTAFVEYANNIIWPMELVGWLSNDFAAAIASNKKINKILAKKSDIEESENPVILGKPEGNIEFRNVYFSMEEKDKERTDILKNINFKVDKGKTLGIMGMTGTGKTSIINLLVRFYDVNEGEILLDGVNIKDLTLGQLRSSNALVMQDVFLFSDSIRENIKIGNRDGISDQEMEEAAEAAGAREFIDKFPGRYDTIIGERGVGLSGGQKQRISIARALAKNAPVLIMDDSTSALDMETEYEIQQNLKSLKDTTKIIIAHRISAVKDADEIIVLKDGEIAERGAHRELMKLRGLYFNTYVVQYNTEEDLVMEN